MQKQLRPYLKPPGIDTQKLLEIQDESGKTAVQRATYENRVEAIKTMLETPGIDTQKLLEIEDKQGIPALNVAAYKGHVKVIKAILRAPGVDKQKLLETPDRSTRRTVLHAAMYKGHMEAVKTILETPGIDTQKLLEIQDGLGKTVLHKAAYEGHVEATKVILKIPGIDKQKLLEIKDKQGATALNWTVHKGHVKEIKELFRHQITTVGIRGNEKKAISFLKPEELQEILEIEFSDELGKANSAVRIERETLVLNAIYDYLKAYGTDTSWKSPSAWVGSLNRISDRVNALMGEIQDIGGIAGGVIVQREIDKVMEKIMPKSQDQSTARNYVGRINLIQQSQNMHRR